MWTLVLRIVLEKSLKVTLRTYAVNGGDLNIEEHQTLLKIIEALNSAESCWRYSSKYITHFIKKKD